MRAPRHPARVGMVTRLGYLYCTNCIAAHHMVDPLAHPVLAGSQPHAAEECDICGQVLDPGLVNPHPLTSYRPLHTRPEIS